MNAFTLVVKTDRANFDRSVVAKSDLVASAYHSL